MRLATQLVVAFWLPAFLIAQDRPEAAKGQGVDPVVRVAVPPVYPAVARLAGIAATVTVEAAVTADGRVADVRVTRSVPLLDAAAVDAVRRWQFTPAVRDERTVTVDLSFTFDAATPGILDEALEDTNDPARDFAVRAELECRPDHVWISSDGRHPDAFQEERSLTLDEAGRRDVYRALVLAGLERFGQTLNLWQANRPMSVVAREQAIEATIFAEPRHFGVCSDCAAGELHTLDVRRGNRWIRLWRVPASGFPSKPEYTDQLRSVIDVLRRNVRRLDAYRDWPPAQRRCV